MTLLTASVTSRSAGLIGKLSFFTEDGLAYLGASRSDVAG
jgi:hypothetical protein